MKLKKLTLFLCAILCIVYFNTTFLFAFADDENEVDMVYVSAVVNGNPRNIPAIKKADGFLFFSGNVLSDITVYNNTVSPMLFQHDKATDDNKYREILIDKDNKKAQLVSFWSGKPIIKKYIELPDIINYEDEWYFPVVEMLPLLNANAVVSDNKLYIEDVPYSMSNIMPEFDIGDYVYSTYNEKDLGLMSSEQALQAYCYLYNTVMNFDLKRLTFLGRYVGEVDSYEDIFSSFLTEDDTYYESLKNEKDYSIPLIDYIQSDDSDRISTIIDAMSPAKDLANNYYNIDEFKSFYENDYKSISSLAEIAKYSGVALDLYSIAAISCDHVDDHYEMLRAVYQIGDEDADVLRKILTDPSYSAANRVYTTYSKNNLDLIVGTICKETEKALDGDLKEVILKEIAEKRGLGNGLLWSQLITYVVKQSYIALDFYVHKVAVICENLGYYNYLMEEGNKQFWAYNNSYNNISKNNIDSARLSAIFTLLSSKAIYKALYDANIAVGYNGTLYQKQIDKINGMLKKLYLAKNCCLTDSEEYIDERIVLLKNAISDVDIKERFDNNNYFEMYKAYFLEHYSMDDLVCLADVTHDGIDEMIVITDGDFKGDTKFSTTIRGEIYTVNQNQIIKIHEKNGATSHAANFFNWYLTKNGDLQENLNGMWQGRGELNFNEYYLTSSGERVDIENIILSNATAPTKADGAITDEAYQEFINDVNSRIENSYLLFSTYDFATVSPKYIELDPRKVFNIDNETTTQNDKNNRSVVLDKKSVFVEKGTCEKRLLAVVNSDNLSVPDIEWKSTNEKVAKAITYDGYDATVIGLETGECVVTANLPNGESASVSVIVYDNDFDKKDDVLAYDNEEYGAFIKDYVEGRYVIELNEKSIQYVNVDNNDPYIKDADHNMISSLLIFDMSLPESISQETAFNAIISQLEKCNLTNSFIWNGYTHSTIYYVPMDKSSSFTQIPILSRWMGEDSYGYSVWRYDKKGFIIYGDPLTG